MKALREKIEREIRERGPIPFSRYMELCLYDEEFGYYSRNAAQFGKAGDFYTSSDIHAVFGRLMARQFEEMWRVLGSPEKVRVTELGPGRGLFARDVMDWSEQKFPEFFRALQYVLVESSPALRQRIADTLSEHIAAGRVLLQEAADPHSEEADGPLKAAERRESSAQGVSRGSNPVEEPAPKERKNNSSLSVNEIVFANEFFDAIPVEILSTHGSLRIDAKGGRFVETWATPSADEREFIDRYSVHPEEDERLEIPLQAQAHMRRAACIERGFAVTIDYGYTREEQLAGRHRGTLKAIRQHSVSANPYEAPGEQDITADVNFTALAGVAAECGMLAHKVITQSQFLMGIGEANQFADAFEDCRLPQERVKVALQLKHLVTPAGMGESFHVLVAAKEINEKTVASLAGLSFGAARPHT